MEMMISKEFQFDAAHNLVNYNGKCERLHGHTYRLQVTLKGNPGQGDMIMDFVEIKKIVNEKVIDKLDHSYLNDVIPQSTAENIIRWIWKELESPLSGKNHELTEIKLWETGTSFITLRRENS